MHRVGWIVQNIRPLAAPLLSAPKLPLGGAFGARVIDDPNSASGGLSVVIDPDKKGRILEAEQIALAKTAEIQIQQVQYREGVQLIVFYYHLSDGTYKCWISK